MMIITIIILMDKKHDEGLQKMMKVIKNKVAGMRISME
jgi:hypothetical protein